ncbi:hypothetical protein GCM10022414_28450 [Zhongshania borealis]|uniref:Uncharacterized protein n=1 Tax=Zhongshania borealis TaxID=889488 RepID=A0ABP7X075_9GAMM
MRFCGSLCINSLVLTIDTAKPSADNKASTCQGVNPANPGLSTKTTPIKPITKGGQAWRPTPCLNHAKMTNGTISGADARKSVASTNEM